MYILWKVKPVDGIHLPGKDFDLLLKTFRLFGHHAGCLRRNPSSTG
jgi:hypothetical protein